MDVTNTPTLARYFAGRIEKAQHALRTVNLAKYADDVTTLVPQSRADFERFAYWCQGLSTCLAAWSALVEVAQHTPHEALQAAQRAVDALARDAADLLAIYERRRARDSEAGLPAEGYAARAARGL